MREPTTISIPWGTDFGAPVTFEASPSVRYRGYFFEFKLKLEGNCVSLGQVNVMILKQVFKKVRRFKNALRSTEEWITVERFFSRDSRDDGPKVNICPAVRDNRILSSRNVDKIRTAALNAGLRLDHNFITQVLQDPESEVNAIIQKIEDEVRSGSVVNLRHAS